jgi:chromosome segregation ATPase
VQGYVRRVQEEAERSKRNSHSVTDELEQLRATNEQLREDLRRADERLAGELAMLKNEYEDRLRRSGNVDAAAQEFYRQRDEWKDRVREELKRIKLKERELENRHELLKRDMQALLDSKDRHVLELKKKNDALELEMETLEDRLRKANVVLGNIEAKKRRLVETLRLSMALLEAIDRTDGRTDGAADPDGDAEKKRRSG